jgi:hypothetical protein
MKKTDLEKTNKIIQLRVEKRLSLGDISKEVGVGKSTCARILQDFPLTKKEYCLIHNLKLKGKPRKNFRCIDLIGKRFGRLLVIKKILTDKRHTRWECKCDCGNIKIVRTSHLLNKETISCGCFSRDQKRKRLCKDPYIVNLRGFLISYKKSAEKRKILFELSENEFGELVSQNCHYCGCKPSMKRKLHLNQNAPGRDEPFFFNGVDRIDSNKGYTVENCVPCCTMCNYAKSDYSQQEFEEWLNRISNYRNLKKGD